MDPNDLKSCQRQRAGRIDDESVLPVHLFGIEGFLYRCEEEARVGYLAIKLEGRIR